MTSMKVLRKVSVCIYGIIALSLPAVASAHEAYVLPKAYFWESISSPFNFSAFSALENSHDLAVTVTIICGILLLLSVNFLFRRTRFGSRVHAYIEHFAYLGPFFVRIAIAAAFFFGAKSGEFLGPELDLVKMPLAELMRWGVYVSSFMILFGVFTEIAAFIGLVIFSIGFFVFGAYLATYFNYLGELIALLLFGSRQWSFDKTIFGPLKKWRKGWQKYETTIVRTFYGLALIYAAINVKLLHTDLTLKVINDWNLTQFHWLFPGDPLLIVLGAGLAEAAIGLFILLGFEIRLTVLISLFYITLSLLFFRELVWPHILLYGISLNLLLQPETFTIDHLLFKNGKRKKQA